MMRILHNYEVTLYKYFLCVNKLINNFKYYKKIRLLAKILAQYKYILLNPFATGNTVLCGGIIGHAKHITMHVVPRKHSLKILVLEKMVPHY